LGIANNLLSNLRCNRCSNLYDILFGGIAKESVTFFLPKFQSIADVINVFLPKALIIASAIHYNYLYHNSETKVKNEVINL
jgi:hypothetical protein